MASVPLLDPCLQGDPATLSAPIKTPSEKFALLPAFLKVRGLVKQHVDSFNYFINKEIRQIVQAQANQKIVIDSDPNFYFKYLDVHVGTPSVEDEFRARSVTPQQCRLRDITYSAPITVDIEYTRGKEIVVKRGKRREGGSVQIGRLPIMLRSDRCVLSGKSEHELAQLGECPLDPGGYFVVKGTEKVILIHEQLAKNRIIIDYDNNDEVKAVVQSSTHERKTVTNIVTKKEKYYLKVNAFSEEINMAIVFRAMGVTSDQEMVMLVGQESAVVNFMVPTLMECQGMGIFTQHQALDYIGSKVKMTSKQQAYFERVGAEAHRQPRAEEARNALANLVLNHVPMKRFNFEHRVAYLGYMLRRMMAAKVDPSLVDDRDYYGNKRMELAGQLISLLFEDLFKRLNWDLQRQAEATLAKASRTAQFDAARCIRQDTITFGFEHALSTGHWSIKRFRIDRKGVTQVRTDRTFAWRWSWWLGSLPSVLYCGDRNDDADHEYRREIKKSERPTIAPAQSMGHDMSSRYSRRLFTPIGRSRWLRVRRCLKGEGCGLTKNLALLTHVTTDEDPTPLSRLAYHLGVEPWGMVRGADLVECCSLLVFLNGVILGVHQRPKRFIRQFRELRRHGRCGEFVSICLHQDRVLISCDGGRVCRPLIICDKGIPRVKSHHLDALKASKMNFNDFIDRGLIEYLDVNEENNALIALYERDCGEQTTHLEIEPFTIMGIVAGLVPYPHHNQSPRNTYQCAMGKQAMGNVAFNQLNRMDTLLYLLSYPQKPLLTSHTIELIGFDRLGAGQNSTLAVMSYSGYDIEDASIMNKASLDRGFGRCIVLRKYGTKVKKYLNRTMDQVKHILFCLLDLNDHLV